MKRNEEFGENTILHGNRMIFIPTTLPVPASSACVK